MKKRIISLLLFGVLLVNPQSRNNLSANKGNKMTATEIVNLIKKNVTCQWQSKTVDTFKGGNPDDEVKGIATTFMATFDVLKKAKSKGLNFIITHEPTYYNHFDETAQFEDDKVVAEKMRFIKENHLIVFRFHDHWHMTNPDGIITGMISRLGWGKYLQDKNNLIFVLPKMTVKDLATSLQEKFNATAVRVVGYPGMEVTNAALVVGAPGSMPQIKSLERDDVEVLIAGETHEWETVEYVRDAVSMGKKKALILIGHLNSEEAGMDYCAEWLKGFVKDTPIEFITSGDPLWNPQLIK
jgi:putative NIF3 family GTP cyclohydrolase 1 type 2